MAMVGRSMMLMEVAETNVGIIYTNGFTAGSPVADGSDCSFTPVLVGTLFTAGFLKHYRHLGHNNICPLDGIRILPQKINGLSLNLWLLEIT